LRSARHGRGPLRRFRQLLQAGRALLVSGQKRLDGEVGGGDLERRSKLPDIKLMWQWGPAESRLVGAVLRRMARRIRRERESAG
jgi:hypothetical protein